MVQPPPYIARAVKHKSSCTSRLFLVTVSAERSSSTPSEQHKQLESTPTGESTGVQREANLEEEEDSDPSAVLSHRERTRFETSGGDE